MAHHVPLFTQVTDIAMNSPWGTGAALAQRVLAAGTCSQLGNAGRSVPNVSSRQGKAP
jgi:hypothetical protein